MSLSDYLPTEPMGEAACRFGRALEALPDDSLRDEALFWMEMRESDKRWGMTAPHMAKAVSRASGIDVSDKTMSKHRDKLCGCYRA